MKIGEVMTHPVVSVRSDASVLEAGKLMLKHDIGGLPVVDAEGLLIGIVTERDFLRIYDLEGASLRPRWLELLIGNTIIGTKSCGQQTITKIMTRDPITATEDMSLEKAVGLMAGHQSTGYPSSNKAASSGS